MFTEGWAWHTTTNDLLEPASYLVSCYLSPGICRFRVNELPVQKTSPNLYGFSPAYILRAYL